ncbi:MAG: CoA-binding protein [Polyangiaceae bacterium]
MHPNVLTTDDQLRALLAQTKRVAVLGIKTEAQADQASFYVPKYLQDAGLDVIPVPIYYPDVTTILGRPVFRALAHIDGEVDLVNVFRKASDLKKHVADILAKKPRAVWFQLGIRDDVVAEELAQAGIAVVQDKCIMVEHRRLL